MPDIVLKLKYSAAYDLAKPLGKAMSAVALEEGMAHRCDLVVPVPITPKRHMHRGYNQAILLARVIAQQLELPCSISAIRRITDPGPQDRLSRSERLTRVKGCFRCDADAVRGRCVLLIDDVMTTGATASECASVLIKSGAKAVEVLVLARAGIF